MGYFLLEASGELILLYFFVLRSTFFLHDLDTSGCWLDSQPLEWRTFLKHLPILETRRWSIFLQGRRFGFWRGGPCLVLSSGRFQGSIGLLGRKDVFFTH